MASEGLEAERGRLCRATADAVQRLMLQLAYDLAEINGRIEYVNVDTRNFANLAVEISSCDHR